MPLPFSAFSRRVLWLPLLLATAVSVQSVRAGDQEEASKTVRDSNAAQATLDAMVPLDSFEAETSYVGQASFREKEFRGANAPGGRQVDFRGIDELQASVTYGHRFHLFDKVYLKLGVDYERFDFGTTTAPLPSTLSNIAGVVNLEYIVKGNVAAFLNTKPGVYYGGSQISLGSVNVPVAAGVFFPVPYVKKVYAVAGGRFSLLSHYPILPIGGVVWLISDHLRLQAVPPNPRLIYSVSKKLDFFVGGELLGESYQRNSDVNARPQFKRFNRGVIDYSEERVGAGLTYSPIKQVDINLAGGWDLQRDFDYYRGESKRFVTHGAPYGRLSVSAEF